MKRFKARIASALINFGIIASDTEHYDSASRTSFNKYAKKYNKALTKYTAEIIKAFEEKKE